MEPELDMFDQWAKETSEKSWIVRKIQWIPLWWKHDGSIEKLPVDLKISGIGFLSFGKIVTGILTTSLI